MNRISNEPLPVVGPTSAEAALAQPMAGERSPRWQLWQALAALQRSDADDAAESAEQLRRACVQACELHGIDVELQGVLPAGPAVLVANHLGYIDPVVLCSLVPCSPIAKQELASWPVVGDALKRLNVGFVRRGVPESGARVLKRCLRTLRDGVSVLNFPEGTTSRGGLLPFQLGAFWLARRSGVPLVPIGMEFETPDMCWVDDDAFLPHYGRVLWGSLRGRRLHVRVCVGVRLDAAQFRSELELCWAARRAIEGLRRPYSLLEPRAS